MKTSLIDQYLYKDEKDQRLAFVKARLSPVQGYLDSHWLIITWLALIGLGCYQVFALGWAWPGSIFVLVVTAVLYVLRNYKNGIVQDLQDYWYVYELDAERRERINNKVNGGF